MDTSKYAYTETCFLSRRAPAMDGCYADGFPQDNSQKVIYGPLLWVFRFLMRLALGNDAPASDGPDPVEAVWLSGRSRRHRRFYSRDGLAADMPAFKQRVSLYRILSKGLNAAQYKEKQVRLFGLSRAQVFGLRYWGSVLQRRAQLSCVDHGWWRMPATSTVTGGLWDVQLPPN